jgi:sulfate transport system substrate-binding protein
MAAIGLAQSPPVIRLADDRRYALCALTNPHPKEQAMSRRLFAALTLAAILGGTQSVGAQTNLLNVSYDVSRELYKDINPAFVAEWKAKGGADIVVNQSHGGSSKQALSVLNGLDADVVTMNQPTDIDVLAQGKLVAADWRSKFPHGAAPYTTVSVFLVRKGNPKSIEDWSDLTREGVSVIVPNPKTSGNGRYTYLAAWGDARLKGGDDAAAQKFVADVFRNVPVLDGGGRGATTTFTQRGICDVLVTFENEAILIGAELGKDQFEIVYPSTSIEAAPPVAVVDSVVDRKGSREAAEAYLSYLFTPEAQKIVARHNFRPRDAAVLEENAAKFAKIESFDVEKLLGPWGELQTRHFESGGLYDQIVAARAGR